MRIPSTFSRHSLRSSAVKKNSGTRWVSQLTVHIDRPELTISLELGEVLAVAGMDFALSSTKGPIRGLVHGQPGGYKSIESPSRKTLYRVKALYVWANQLNGAPQRWHHRLA
ncbi:hypothetical protein SCLCIDRAFT_1224924 [Scleroderma citrinum Foug A]|uniref:Uncharacterized protein n=1 Tax=Scleroderma citrinum Foug A TaxID=1036808 RepID=A0A0C3D4H4_9AGAM|nr:hypothetical protein SCLCIDRAFT_1224924 [Scleroderma citrinum Foug A]